MKLNNLKNIEKKKLILSVFIYFITFTFFFKIMLDNSDFIFANVVEGFIFLSFLFLIIFAHLFSFENIKEKIIFGIIDLIPLLIFVIFSFWKTGPLIFGAIALFFLAPLFTIIFLNFLIHKLLIKLKILSKKKSKKRSKKK